MGEVETEVDGHVGSLRRYEQRPAIPRNPNALLCEATVMVNWVSLAAGAVPTTLTILFKILNDRSDDGTYRRIEKHIELLAKLPASSTGQMEELIKAEVNGYTNRRKRIAERTVDKMSVFLVIFFGAITMALLYFGVSYAFDHRWFWFLLVPLAVFLLAMIGAGLGSVYKYPPDVPSP